MHISFSQNSLLKLIKIINKIDTNSHKILAYIFSRNFTLLCSVGEKKITLNRKYFTIDADTWNFDVT
jgi:hypothetical protein